MARGACLSYPCTVSANNQVFSRCIPRAFPTSCFFCCSGRPGRTINYTLLTYCDKSYVSLREAHTQPVQKTSTASYAMGPRQILPSSSASDTLGARNTDISGSHNLTVSSNTTEQQKGDSVPNLARSQDLSLYSPTELANWDWGESVQLSDHFYEPQGVLVEELQNQQNPGQDFVIPHPVSANLSGDCSNEQQRQQRQSGNGASQHPVFATPAQKPLGPRASLKRKATSEPSGASATDLTPLSTSRSASQRQRAEAQAMTGDTDNPTQTAPRPPATRSRSTTSVSGSADAVNRPRQGGAATGGGSSRTLPGGHADPLASRSRRRTLPDAPDTPFILPPRKVFPIQIGSELFRLSGASISSDGKSRLDHVLNCSNT